MCATCGCGDDAGTRVTLLVQHDHPGDQHGPDHHPHDDDHAHPHDHDHAHPHDDDDRQGPSEYGRTVVLEQQILAKNATLAQRNRGWLADRGVFAVNLMSSPGAGKTTLLEQTISALGGQVQIAVIEGDQETPLDAERIRASGGPVVQINTGAGCHLDADMVRHGLLALDPAPGSLLFIENVGNLVCPALFDLGEARKVILTSVTEGADKPLKYPHMFAAADLVLVNKMDLLPYVNFDMDRFSRDLRRLNGNVEMLTVTATRIDELSGWFNWLNSSLGRSRSFDHLDFDLDPALEL